MLTGIRPRRTLVTLVSCALAVLGGWLLAPATPVVAATTYYVGSTGDSSFTTTGCAIASNTTCTLRSALAQNATDGGGTITFATAAFPANTAKTITLS